MNGFANALIRAAAANVAGHEIVDVRVSGIGLFCKERHRGHDLAGLAITTLRNVFFHPGFLYRMRAVWGETLDGGDFFSGDAGNGSFAGALHLVVNVDGTCSAE